MSLEKIDGLLKKLTEAVYGADVGGDYDPDIHGPRSQKRLPPGYETVLLAITNADAVTKKLDHANQAGDMSAIREQIPVLLGSAMLLAQAAEDEATVAEIRKVMNTSHQRAKLAKH